MTAAATSYRQPLAKSLPNATREIEMVRSHANDEQLEQIGGDACAERDRYHAGNHPPPFRCELEGHQDEHHCANSAAEGFADLEDSLDILRPPTIKTPLGQRAINSQSGCAANEKQQRQENEPRTSER
jgi:hypothetical protein